MFYSWKFHFVAAAKTCIFPGDNVLPCFADVLSDVAIPSNIKPVVIGSNRLSSVVSQSGNGFRATRTIWRWAVRVSTTNQLNQGVSSDTGCFFSKVFFVDEDLVPSLVAKMSLETGRLEKQQGTVLITHGFTMHADPGAQRPNYPKKVSCREAKLDMSLSFHDTRHLPPDLPAVQAACAHDSMSILVLLNSSADPDLPRSVQRLHFGTKWCSCTYL